jgi:hypothetical protein
MLRTVGIAILGYIIVAGLVFLSFSVAYWIMGADGAFQPGTYHITMGWIATTVVLGFAAAMVGGLVVARMGKTGNEVAALAGLVFLLGVLFAIATPGGDATPAARDAAVGMMEAMANAVQPQWVAWLNAVIGAGGVLLGGRLHTREQVA